VQYASGIANAAGIQDHIDNLLLHLRALPRVGIRQEKRPPASQATRPASVPLLAFSGHVMAHNIRPVAVGTMQHLRNHGSLILDSRVLRDQELNECRKQRVASLADVVHELKETQVEREFLLGNTPMRAEPTPQQGPEPFHGMHMDFTKAVAIFIAGELALAMVDTPMVVSPAMQASINALLVCIHTCTWNDGVFDKGFDGLLLDRIGICIFSD